MINEICKNCNHHNGFVCDAHWQEPLKNSLYDTISKLDDCLYLNRGNPRLYNIWFNVLLDDDTTESLSVMLVCKNTQEIENFRTSWSKPMINQTLNGKKIKSVISTSVDILTHVDGYDIELKKINY